MKPSRTPLGRQSTFHGVKPAEPVKANLGMSMTEMLKRRGLDSDDVAPGPTPPVEAAEVAQSAPASAVGSQEVRKLDVSLIDPSPYQPRLVFQEEALVQLADAILLNGRLIDPITVRPKAGGRYELIAGERRTRVHRDILGWPTIDALVMDVSDKEAAIFAALDNQGAPLSDFEYALAYSRMLEDKVVESQLVLSRRVGISASKMSRLLALLELPEPVLEILKEQPGLVGPKYVSGFLALAKEGRDDLVLEAVKQVADGASQEAALRWAKGMLKAPAAKPKAPVAPQPIILGQREVAQSVFKGKRLTLDFADAEEGRKLFDEFKAFLASREGRVPDAERT